MKAGGSLWDESRWRMSDEQVNCDMKTLPLVRCVGWGVVAGGAALLALGGCATAEQPGTALNVVATTPLDIVAEFPHQQITGVAVSRNGRIFANFPYWSDGHTVSVIELGERGEQRPYPNADWNRMSGAPIERFVCVQSVHVDAADNLWIVDAGSPKQTGVIEGGAKLVKVDLTSNRVTQVIHFDRGVAPEKSYLNDVRVDTRNNFAFLTDSNLGAIIVVDLTNEQAKRVLENDPSVKAEPNFQLRVGGNVLIDPEKEQPLAIASDGLALDEEGRWLYYKALTGRTLYRVPVDDLEASVRTDVDLGNRVERLAQVPASDGLTFHEGKIYLSAIEDNAVVRFDPESRTSELIVRDQRLNWPDSFAFDRQGTLYVTTSQIHLTPRFNRGETRIRDPYRLFRMTRSDIAATARPLETSSVAE
jgi:sugar lactone lactonase YvrE